jgi:hypothetical protein
MVSRWRRCSSRSETHREYLRRYAPALRCPCFACVPAQSLPGLGVRRDNPFATHSLLRLGTGPSLPWLGRSPGRASPGHSPYSGSPTGLLSCSGSPCSACKSWACLPALRPCASRSLLRLRTGPSLPWLGRSPGQQSTGLLSFSGSPCCARKSGAEHPGSARSPGQSLRYALPASLGHRPKLSVAWAFAGTSVPRTLALFRLTPRSLGNAPVHPWRARSATVSEPNARQVSGYCRSL